MSQREKRKKKIPKHLNEYLLGTKEHSKHDMVCSDEGDENITFIPPKPKIAKIQNKLEIEVKKNKQEIKATKKPVREEIELNLVPSSQFEPNDNNPER